MFDPKAKDKNETENKLILQEELNHNFGPAAKILEEIFQDDEAMINYAITKLDKY